MNGVTLSTSTRHWRPVFGTNRVDADAGTFNAPSATLPTNAVPTNGANLAKFLCYGIGTSGSSGLNMIVSGYNRFGDETTDKQIWVPSFICKAEFLWAGTSMTGLSAKQVINTENFADTVTVTAGDTSVRVITGATQEAASITVDLEGCEMVGITFDTTGVTQPTTSYNALIGLF